MPVLNIALCFGEKQVQCFRIYSKKTVLGLLASFCARMILVCVTPPGVSDSKCLEKMG